MYEKFALELKKGNETTQINYLIGVHQRDSLVPLLFLLVFQAAMESLELTSECKESIGKIEYKYFPNMQKDKPRIRLTGQSTKTRGRDVTHWLYVYDGSAFILPTREDAIRIANLTLNHLQRFGLKMYTGTASKKSKTKVLFIPKRDK